MAKVRKTAQGNWFVDYRCNGIRYREVVGTNKQLALAVLNKRLLEIAEGRFLDKKILTNTLFADFSSEYISIYSKQNKKSWKADITRLTSLVPFFAGKCLHEITPRLVEEYKAKRSKEVKTSTINRELACLKHIFTVAIEWGRVEANPVKRVKLYRENNARVRYLEREEAERLVNACSGYLRNIVIVALNTGIRKSSILNLKWQDIDIKRRVIYLHDSKNGEKQEIPMNDTAKAVFIQQPKNPASPYVFAKEDGTPFGDIKKGFLSVLAKLGVKDFKFHDLRHTFASQLVMGGIDLNTVRELMGHKSIRMTLRYSHLSPAHKQRAVDVLSTKWALNGQLVSVRKEAEKTAVSQVVDKSEFVDILHQR